MSRSLRVALAGTAGTLAAAGAGLLAVSADGVNALVEPSHGAEHGVRVLSATSHSVTLERSEGATRPGVFGLWWDGGYAQLDDVIAVDDRAITRALRQPVTVPAGPAHLDHAVWPTDPREARGLPFVEVRPSGELGPLPCWYVDAPRDTWVVLVHGHGGDRRRCLRPMKGIAAAGLPQVVMSWRSDGFAPASPDRRHHLGDTEWRDLHAVVEWAAANGARSLILYGMSMGAAIVGAFLARSSFAGLVSRVVLDAPVVDWRAVLRKQAADRHLPPAAATVPELMLRRRLGIDLDEFDFVRRSTVFGVPTLIMHGLADETVPIESSRAFVAAGPGRQLEEFADAGHELAWNVDPTRYRKLVTAFLS